MQDLREGAAGFFGAATERCGVKSILLERPSRCFVY